MKLISVYTPSHRELKERWFLPSLRDNYEVCVRELAGGGAGGYLSADWSDAVRTKCETIIGAILDNLGDAFVYSDVDVQFFAPTQKDILRGLQRHDIVCQMDDPQGLLCSGFFGIHANRRTLRLWENVRAALRDEGRDQLAFNRIIRHSAEVRHGVLPLNFFGPGTFRPSRWEPGDRLHIPPSPRMFHANWTISVERKIQLHAMVKRVVDKGRPGIVINNLLYLLREKRRGASRLTKAKAFVRGAGAPPSPNSLFRPSTVGLEASTVCQLKCPTCPTAGGLIGKTFGSGFLTRARFEKFISDHPWVTEVELSNWGEAFLNPELPAIMEHARNQRVILKIQNGANLNTVREETLEALVRYRVHSLSCSLDGASQETYTQYRVKGDFHRVIANIEKINHFKRLYQSPFPRLTWQFIVFGHNEHEVEKARARARDLGMKFYLKLSWDHLYGGSFSPVRARDGVRSRPECRAADRREYEEKFGRPYIEATCHQLWLSPKINFDGRLLGCCINHWGDYGNVFEEGLDACLAGDRMMAARRLLTGREAERKDTPCLNCGVYRSRRKLGCWVALDCL